MDATKKQSNKTGPVGKKRKKRSKKEREISGQPKVGVSTTKGGDHKSKTKSSDSNPLSSALTIRKLEDQYSSSNSSIEIHRPLHKLKRYDESSDAMSIATRDSQLAHSDITTESGTDTSSMSYSSLTTKCKPLQEDDKTSLTCSISDETRSNKLEIDAKVRLESLRWENEVSDEEQERIRIEEYKIKRRHRYQQALLLQREQLATRTATRKHYYYYSN